MLPLRQENIAFPADKLQEFKAGSLTEWQLWRDYGSPRVDGAVLAQYVRQGRQFTQSFHADSLQDNA